jgi:hypothetical protein
LKITRNGIWSKYKKIRSLISSHVINIERQEKLAYYHLIRWWFTCNKHLEISYQVLLKMCPKKCSNSKKRPGKIWAWNRFYQFFLQYILRYQVYYSMYFFLLRYLNADTWHPPAIENTKFQTQYVIIREGSGVDIFV